MAVCLNGNTREFMGKLHPCLESSSIAWRAPTFVFMLLASAVLAGAQQSAVFLANSETPAVDGIKGDSSPFIVIGFVGGFVRHDDTVHSPVQLATRLRADYPSGISVSVFENRRREQAHQEVVRLLDRNHDGVLSEEEKRDARIVIYGMSWGGTATVELARALDRDKIPVLLTIQVDSVEKWGENGRLIPANVREAANFYQPDGLVHGEQEIQAADPSRTRILGNFRYDYKSNPIDCPDYPWWDRIFVKQHTEIECDAKVWSRVESLIRSKLPPR